MIRLDTATRASLILAALCVSFASIIGAVSMTTRTTPAGEGAVYRQNLITGRGEFCSPLSCRPDPADYSARAAAP
ncbi:hypothetical protein [Brevundimonas sp. TWP3-1-2b1]|uniref:hypothetical protein n=1 Tax=Brevundimonas sp. TWP3-1-2b1 TaxID=2804650 RepID=UPI003CE786B5